jgi:hypothetical protein
MNSNFNFDAEGVFDERPRRPPRRTRKKHWRENNIKQLLMRAPKLLKDAMPRVILKEKYLQQPRSAESEFGLKWLGALPFIEDQSAKEIDPVVELKKLVKKIQKRKKKQTSEDEIAILENGISYFRLHGQGLLDSLRRTTLQGSPLEMKNEKPTADQRVFYTQDKVTLQRVARKKKFDKIGTS